MAALALAAWLAVGVPLRVPPEGSSPGAAVGEARGRLAVPLDAGLFVLEYPSQREIRLVPPERGASVTSAAWSPDGDQIAYGYFYRKPGDNATSAEIFVLRADGGEPRLVVERDRPGAQVDFPSWAPDGRALYFSVVRQEGLRFITRVERIELASGERSEIADGYAPWASPDGRLVAFMRDTRLGPELWLVPSAGGEPRQVLEAGRFSGIASPRFDPEGSQITFAGAVPPGVTQRLDSLIGMFGVPVANAHGDPFDLWSVPVQGGEPRRLATIGEDEPSIAWSPDGRYMALYAPGGLYVIDRQNMTPRRVSDRGGYGGIDWSR